MTGAIVIGARRLRERSESNWPGSNLSPMDRLYSTPSWQLAITLFVILLGGMFAGFLLGKNAARHGELESGAADSAVKGAVAGLAALLLAFSFSLAAGRYDQRNTLVLRE